MSSKSSTSSAMDKFVEFASKIGAQRHLASLRDGFVSIMPIIIAGSIAHILILQIPLSLNPTPGLEVMTWRDFLSQHVPWFVDICLQVWWATFGMITLYAVFSISYHLARSYNSNGLAAGIVSLASFATLIPQSITIVTEAGEEIGAWGNISWSYLSANALFVGIIVAFVATEIFTRLSKTDKLVIKMPEGVPPAVSKSFASLFPGIITFFVIASAGVFLNLIFKDNVFNLMTAMMAPIVNAADSLGAALGIVFLNQILWFFGLHGSNILEGVIQPVSLTLLGENLEAYNAGLALPHIVTKPFLDTFVHLGGSGATLGMVIAILVVSRSKAQRTMGKLAIGPGVFNINEPVIFGIPIVLNFVFIIPFIFVPLILVVVSYLATSIGLVNATVAQVPWATPPILSGWLATGGDWRAIVLQLVNIGITIACYIPFVRIADNAELKKEQAAMTAQEEQPQPQMAE